MYSSAHIWGTTGTKQCVLRPVLVLADPSCGARVHRPHDLRDCQLCKRYQGHVGSICRHRVHLTVVVGAWKADASRCMRVGPEACVISHTLVTERV